MDSDRELLELAAKAAGLTIARWVDGVPQLASDTHQLGKMWNPLTDDGDALRLAVELDMEIAQGDEEGPCAWINYFIPGTVRWLSLSDQHTKKRHKATKREKQAATRRAIVRAAAEIGNTMK